MGRSDSVSGGAQARRVSVQYDGGADEHVLPLRFVKENFPSLQLRGPGRGQGALKGLSGLVPTVGVVDMVVTHGNRHFIDYFIVVDADISVLLGNRARLALGLTLGGLNPVPGVPGGSSDLSRSADTARLFDTEAGPIADVPPAVQRLLDHNVSIPAHRACSHHMATVRVDVPIGTKPHRVYQRRLPRDRHEAVAAQVSEWLRDGIIEKCPWASDWNLNLVVVKKASEPGSPPKFRVCIDPRPINA
ncbi:MAG: hypothetical protein AN485_23215, partial [Anabaena sp. MDT14b]